MFLRKVLMILAAAPCFAVSFTFGESMEVSEGELVELILENQGYCTNGIEDGKIYLKPENVFPVDEETFLRVENMAVVRLPCVWSDEKGYFISMQ